MRKTNLAGRLLALLALAAAALALVSAMLDLRLTDHSSDLIAPAPRAALLAVLGLLRSRAR